MPLGLWKSKWEIHREDMERHRQDMERYREEAERRHAEYREERARVDAEFADMRRRSDELRDECRKDIKAALEIVGDQLLAMRKELHENTDAVRAQTEAILKLVDRFEAWEGRLFPEG